MTEDGIGLSHCQYIGIMPHNIPHDKDDMRPCLYWLCPFNVLSLSIFTAPDSMIYNILSSGLAKIKDGRSDPADVQMAAGSFCLAGAFDAPARLACSRLSVHFGLRTNLRRGRCLFRHCRKGSRL